ncbi:uncharacterized protein TRAVEDRAFT_21341 [Trametes versicolor FP-101664 SS1]|uniref:uncharacterized protein n=1 Tax=Trametes versicolor (strain FP-101664) TaxID=717944 RepID=UPI000462259A|nr:uncharacterized protein TRAVEDRAFT_21341 [Trametes versicolor FP-101664 SS1]EIW57863.1 hypothetical protein TRAVEDRAFT_21341 [Trametes versicolor FP-101664 SS1]
MELPLNTDEQGIFLPETLIWVVCMAGTHYRPYFTPSRCSRLNSRKFSATRGIEIFDTATFGPNIIARANHIAAVERWNTPQVIDEPLQKSTSTFEAEVDVQHEVTEQHYRDQKAFGSESV